MIDSVIVFSYLGILLLFTIYHRSKKRGLDKISRVSDKRVIKSKLILVATIFASSTGGGAAFGLSEKIFSKNISYIYALLFAITTDIVIAIYILPKLIKHHGVESIGDIMSLYYGNVGRYIAGFSVIAVSVGFFATQISVSGRIFEYILGIDYFYAVIISYSVAIIYTTVGGLRSVLFADQIQFFVMIIAIPTIMLFAISDIGFDNLITHIPTEKVAINTMQGQILTLALSFAVMNLFPTFIQRSIINPDYKQTQNVIYIKSGIFILFLVFITISSLCAFVKHPDIEPNLALAYLIDTTVPSGIKGFVIVGLLATAMSTADSNLNMLSITITKDFLSPIFSIQNQKLLLLISRISNVVSGSIAIFIALSFSRIIDMVIFISGFWIAIMIVPFTFALFDILISRRALIKCSFVGALCFIICEYIEITDLRGVFIGLMANLIMFLFYLSKDRRDLEPYKPRT